MSSQPPGPKGNLLFNRPTGLGLLEFFVNNQRQYGDVVHFNIATRRAYQLNNPDDIQYVLVKHPEQFHKSPTLKRATQQAIGQGLLTSDGEFHKRQRKLVQPAFHHKRIAAYAAVMTDYATEMVAGWRDQATLDIAHEMMELTMRIVGKTLFDADMTGEADAIGDAITIGLEATIDRMQRPFAFDHWLPTAKYRERQRAGQVLEAAIQNIIEKRRQSSEDKGDLLSMLLLAVDEDDGGQMTNQQVRDEAMTLFIAGHETTANALAWTFYLLGQHPEIESRLRAELDTALSGRTATITDLPNLPLLEWVIKESMRLYPPAWVISREAIEPVTLGGYDIPRGSIIMMSIYVLHRDPRFWDEPEQFRPERFAPGWDEHVPKYAYFPFGGGPRVCIGNQFAMMEAQLILATVLQQTQLTLIPNQKIEPQPLVTLRPRHGIQMRVHLPVAEPVLAL